MILGIVAAFLLTSPALSAERAEGVQRDARGRIERSRQAVAEFRRQNPCPSTGRVRGACPGWVIDHIWPLACGGADSPWNMAWQTVADAKAKDRWERRLCAK